MKKINETVAKTEVKPLDVAELKKALTVRTNVRAGFFAVKAPEGCSGCGRGL